MGCLFSVFHRNSIDKKTISLLNNDHDVIQRSQREATSNLSIQKTNPEEKQKKSYVKIKCLEKQKYSKFFLIKHNDNSQYYLLKIIKIEYLNFTGLIQQLDNEIKILQICKNQPYFIQYHEHFRTDKKCYIIFEYLEGQTLSTLISQGLLNEENVQFIIKQLLQALQFLHSKNIIYRNITPNGIWIDKNSNIRLIDFQFATEDYETNIITGNIYYQAPELLTLSSQTYLADYWSLGAIMYHMLIGYPPYFNPNLIQYKKDKYQGNLQLPDTLSQNANQLLHQLLSNDIQKRINYKGIEEISLHKYFQDFSSQECQRNNLSQQMLLLDQSQIDKKEII